MTRDRFQQIKSNFHLVDNSKKIPKDKLFKIKPLLELKNTQMIEELSIDEQMVPFKGISRLKQYISKKPYKWGFKLYCFS